MATNHSGPSAGSVALAFLSGALLGAVTAIMLAPQPGRESRDRLLGYARRTGDDLLDLKERATEAVEEVVGRGRELVEEISCAVREAIDAGRDAMKREREMNNLD